jgi:hypothetical protein
MFESKRFRGLIGFGTLIFRHRRARPGDPWLVDARHKAGHDEEKK